MLDRLIAEVEAEAQGQSLGKEQFVLEQRMLEEQAPAIWRRLRAALKAKSEAYPQHFRFEVCAESEVLIRGTVRRTLEARFLPASKLVKFDCEGGLGCYTIRLDRKNVAVLCDQDGAPYPSEDYAAEQLLAMVLGKTA